MVYTIGNVENYDKYLIQDNLYKSKGGTVWTNLSSVIDYYNNSKVYIEDKEVESAIYIVKCNINSDIDFDPNYKNRGTLNKPCKIVKKTIILTIIFIITAVKRPNINPIIIFLSIIILNFISNKFL